MSYANFLKKNLAYIKLGSLVRLGKPIDFLIVSLLTPLIGFGIEAAFWLGIFRISGQEMVGGFSQAQYLTYLLWLITQVGSPNWRFDRIMISEINSGAVNTLLIRPGSFYEFHLWQFLSFKLLTLVTSLPLLLLIAYSWQLPLILGHLIPAICLGICYLLLIYTVNFAVACLAFSFDHVYSLNTTKNMIIWFLSGELFPLDLLPSPLKEWLIYLPFSCGVYIPAGYISGRISTELFLQSFVSVLLGCIFFGWLGRILWMRGLRRYSGTGA